MIFPASLSAFGSEIPLAQAKLADNFFKSETSAWKKTVTKNEFLLGLPKETPDSVYKLYEKHIGDTLTYLLVNNNEIFQEYLDFDNTGKFTKLSADSISKTGSTATIQIKENKGVLLFNDKELEGFVPFAKFDDIVVHDIFLIYGMSCCKACYTVHNILDIHQLDCLCCLGSCGFGCNPQFTISWSLF